MKIFCLGLSKTGTSSLAGALSLLGYKTVHWHYTRTTFNYIDGEIKIDYDKFSDYDAFADTPIARIYKQLDESYPGSKFILTVRDESRWLESFRNQFEKGLPAKFDAKLHMDLYGTDSYNHDLCLNAFNDHTESVKQYFEGRENDLLILDIARGDGWQKLCPFLGKPIPEQAFPLRYAKHERELGFRLQRLFVTPHKIPVYFMRRIRRFLKG